MRNNILYIFSPAVLFILVALFATQPCFDDESDAEKYVERRLPDIDAMISSLRQGWAQLEVAKKWLNNDGTKEDRSETVAPNEAKGGE